MPLSPEISSDSWVPSTRGAQASWGVVGGGGGASWRREAGVWIFWSPQGGHYLGCEGPGGSGIPLQPWTHPLDPWGMVAPLLRWRSGCWVPRDPTALDLQTWKAQAGQTQTSQSGIYFGNALSWKSILRLEWPHRRFREASSPGAAGEAPWDGCRKDGSCNKQPSRLAASGRWLVPAPEPSPCKPRGLICLLPGDPWGIRPSV